MGKAEKLLEEIRELLHPVEKKFYEHAYLDALEAGTIGRKRLNRFAGEQYHILSSDLRSIALLLSRESSAAGREFFWAVLQGEMEAFKALGVFAAALNMTGKDLETYEPAAGAQAYKAFMAWLGVFGASAEVAAAFLVNFPAWGANCGRMSRCLQAKHGFKQEEVAFFDLFSTSSPEFEKMALDVVQEGLDRGVDPVVIKRSSKLVQEYELMFWDTIHALSTA